MNRLDEMYGLLEDVIDEGVMDRLRAGAEAFKKEYQTQKERMADLKRKRAAAPPKAPSKWMQKAKTGVEKLRKFRGGKSSREQLATLTKKYHGWRAERLSKKAERLQAKGKTGAAKRALKKGFKHYTKTGEF